MAVFVGHGAGALTERAPFGLQAERIAQPPSSEAIETGATTSTLLNETAMPLLVNAAHPLPEGYQPTRLVNLYAQADRQFDLDAADILMEEEAYAAMNAMFSAARQDGVAGFLVTSGYRTREEQQRIYDATTDGTAAAPGTSEHETGLAFDVAASGGGDFTQTAQFQWLYAHCAEYGFILRYPQGKEAVTGYPYEPWHYRYVGVAHAAAVMDGGLTLEEYVDKGSRGDAGR